MKSVLIKKEVIDETLASPSIQGKKLLEPLKLFADTNNLPINILEDVDVLNEAEIHSEEADLCGCIEGEVSFVCGGELIDPWIKKNQDGTCDEKEIRAKEIKNGEEFILKAGDWLYIPPGEPHKHACKSVARFYIIKIPKKYGKS